MRGVASRARRARPHIRCGLVAALGVGIFSLGCDKGTTLELDGASSRTIEFQCGELLLEAGRMGPILTLVSNYNLIEGSVADISFVQVRHADTLLPFVVYKNGELIQQPSFPVEGKGFVSMQIKQRAERMDTIVVELSGYLKCNGGRLDSIATRIVIKKAKRE